MAVATSPSPSPDPLTPLEGLHPIWSHDNEPVEDNHAYYESYLITLGSSVSFLIQHYDAFQWFVRFNKLLLKHSPHTKLRWAPRSSPFIIISVLRLIVTLVLTDFRVVCTARFVLANFSSYCQARPLLLSRFPLPIVWHQEGRKYTKICREF